MGMFDYISCEYPLPNNVWKFDFQTKCFECTMGEYVITKGGLLVKVETYTVIVPEEQRPYYSKPEWEKDAFKVCGIFQSIPIGLTDLNYHGDIDFYNERHWFLARFTHGVLEYIEEHTPGQAVSGSIEA